MNPYAKMQRQLQSPEVMQRLLSIVSCHYTPFEIGFKICFEKA